jgi:hypothetical protein
MWQVPTLRRKGVRQVRESTLVERARGGDDTAAAELFSRHWPRAWRIAFALTRDRSAADDAAQRRRGGDRSIIEREDDDLRRSGIYPGHPSLVAPLLDEEQDESAGLPTRETEGDREP